MTNFGQEVGFDFDWKGFTLSGTYFNNNLNNFIDFVTVCNTSPACAAPFITAAGLSPAFTTVRQYQNVGNATFQGFELIATWQPFEQLKLIGSFTNTVAYLTSSTNPALVRTGVQLGQVPNYMFTAGVEWRPIENLVLTASMKSFPQYWNDTGHTQLNDGATLIDLGVRWSPAKDVDIYGSIQNLTNVQYLASGLYADVVRRVDGQCVGHPPARDAADRDRRHESEVLMRLLLCARRTRPVRRPPPPPSISTASRAARRRRSPPRRPSRRTARSGSCGPPATASSCSARPTSARRSPRRSR